MANAATANTPVPIVSRKGIWGWMLFDWAQQPFHTLIITFIFAPYFASVVAPNAVAGQEMWGWAAAIGGIAVALLSPVLGALSDATGPRKPWILGFSLIGALGCWALWYMLPGASNSAIFWGLGAFVLATIGIEFASVFNNAMMPGLVTRQELGPLSGNAWALGYAGGLICLIAVLTLMAASPESGKTLVGLAPIFGLDPLTHEGDRAVGPLTAIWSMLFIIPMFLFTPDLGRRTQVKGAISRGLAELWQTIKTLPKQKSYFSFLLSSMFYRDALNGLYTFGGIYAAGVLGWTSIQLGVFGILASLAGVFGSIGGGYADTRIGTKTVVVISILVLIFASAIVISTSPQGVLFFPVAEGSGLPNNVFYFAGCLIGASGGALQSASRPLLVDQADPQRMGEAFGLYALTGRATSFIAPAAIAIMTGMFDSQRIGITPILALFVIGLLLLIPVKSRV